MKISDKKLQSIIDGEFVTNDDILDALEELQQLREERRWRKLIEEAPSVSAICQFRINGRTGEKTLRFVGTKVDGERTWEWENPDPTNYKWEEKIPTEHLIGMGITDWRPLLMDLPEVKDGINGR